MMDPPITIGLPVYNGERFLSDALASIRAQTFADFQLVISDNASTDRTLDIVGEHAAQDDRIVLLRSEFNHGAAWNYNRVLGACRSPYFKWAAADDVLAPTFLERLHATLEASSTAVVLAYPHTQFIDADGVPILQYIDELASPPGAKPYARLRRVLTKMQYGNVAFSLMRTEALRRTRQHGTYPFADYVLLAELALAGEFRAVPEPLFMRRLHEGISIRANPTTASLSEWYDPQQQPVRGPWIRVLREYVAAVGRAELSRSQRLLSYAIVGGVWTRRQAAPRTRAKALFRRLRHR